MLQDINVNKQRPVNLNLFTIKFPIPAIVSILHRLSGVLVFLLIPLFLWMLHTSLASVEQFDALQDFFANPLIRLVIWAGLSALLFHLVAGIRHLLMDTGLGESLKAGEISAWLVIGISAFLIICAGIWLW